MSHEPDEVSDEDDFTQAVVDAVYELPGALANTAPVRRGLSIIGMMAVALVGAPLLIILTLAWALVAGPVIDVLLPPGGGSGVFRWSSRLARHSSHCSSSCAGAWFTCHPR